MLNRRRKTTQETRPGLAMIPMPVTASSNNYENNNAVEGASAAINTRTTSKNIAYNDAANDNPGYEPSAMYGTSGQANPSTAYDRYSNVQQPSDSAAGAVGDGIYYEPSDMMYESIDDNSVGPEVPPPYEIIRPKRPRVLSKFRNSLMPK